MSINAKIINALSPLNIPVKFMEHVQGEPAYIVFHTYKENEAGFFDDVNDSKVSRIALSFWYSKPEHFDMIEQIETLMKQADFRAGTNQDAPMEDGHYCRHFDFSYIKYL